MVSSPEHPRQPPAADGEESPLREELGQIDISSIADLVRIKREEEVLAERLATMESRKGQVSALVYRRVRGDYETRKAALESESRPLKEKARREYARLRELREKAERAVEETSLEKEELEFRRDLGEFPDSQFRERLDALERKLVARRAELEAVDETKAKFVGAFHTESDLEGAMAPSSPSPPSPAPAPDPSPVRAPAPAPTHGIPPPPPAAVTPPPPASRPSAPSGRGGRAPGPPPPPPPEPRRWELPPLPEAEVEPAPVEATVLEPGVARPGVPPPPPPAAFAEAPGPTVVLTIPRLVMIVDGKPGKEHVLKPGITTLGRSPKTDIQVLFSEVSRTHAELVWEADGFAILDLDSENGVFVNGERVKKQALKDGDAIQIGPQKFVFRM
jgi:hypothetical protein